MKRFLSLALVLILVFSMCFSLTSCSDVELEDDGRTGKTTVTKKTWDKYVKLEGVTSYDVEFEADGTHDFIFADIDPYSDKRSNHVSVEPSQMMQGGLRVIDIPYHRFFTSEAPASLSALEFEDFEYDEDTRSYVYEGEIELETVDETVNFFNLNELDCVISVKFEDDELTKIDVYAEGGFLFFVYSLYMHESFVFSDFN